LIRNEIIRNLFFLIVCLLDTGVMAAQDFRKAMGALHDRYQNGTSLEIKMNVKVFERKESTAPFYSTDVLIKKSGSKYLYRFGTHEMLMNENYTLMVDHSTKEMVLAKRDPSAEEAFLKQTQFSLDSILNYYEQGQFLGRKDGTDTYSVMQKTGNIGKIEFSIDHATGSLKRLTYLYRTNQFVSIVFDHFDAGRASDEVLFDEKNFVSKEGRVWKPAKRFTGYTVSDVNRKNTAAVNP